MEKDYKKLDEAVYSIYCYLHALAKNDKEIVLRKFDRNNDAHMGLLYIASMEKKVFNFQLFLNCDILTYWITKWEFHKFVGMKYKSHCKDTCPTCDEIIKKIETLFHPGIVLEIYNTYYARKRN